MSLHVYSVVEHAYSANISHYEEALVELYTRLGDGFRLENIYQASLYCYKKVLAMQDDKLSKRECRCSILCYKISEVYEKIHDLDSALKYFLKYLDVIETVETAYCRESDIVGYTYHRLGMLYAKKEIYEKAIDCVQIALYLFKMNLIENIEIVANVYHDLALLYEEKQQYGCALKMYNESWELYGKFPGRNELTIIEMHANVANFLYKMGAPEEALKSYAKIIPIRYKFQGIDSLAFYSDIHNMLQAHIAAGGTKATFVDLLSSINVQMGMDLSSMLK